MCTEQNEKHPVLSFRTNPELAEKVKEKAKETGVSRSQFLEEIVERAVCTPEKVAA